MPSSPIFSRHSDFKVHSLPFPRSLREASWGGDPGDGKLFWARGDFSALGGCVGRFHTPARGKRRAQIILALGQLVVPVQV